MNVLYNNTRALYFIERICTLRVNYVNQIRCFYGLGNGKDILVPFKEQARPEKEKLFGLSLYG
jgi:hypothetical protein